MKRSVQTHAAAAKQIRVTPGHFANRLQALDDIRRHGLHLMEMQVPPVGNDSHWHHFSTRIYILEGELNITDATRGVTLRAGPGALVEVPERVLHAEQSAGGYAIVAGLSVDPATLTGPIDLDPGAL